MKLVHPDLFSNHPAEKHVNTESLKLFSNALERFQSGLPFQASLHFYVQSGDRDRQLGFEEIFVDICDDLTPLYEAFGLEVPADLATEQKQQRHADLDVSLVEWLRNCAQVCVISIIPRLKCVHRLACHSLV